MLYIFLVNKQRPNGWVNRRPNDPNVKQRRKIVGIVAGFRSDKEWVKLAKQDDPVAIQWALDRTRRARELEARKWFVGEEDILDAEQEAVLAVLEAIRKCNTNVLNSFLAYARWRIKCRVQKYFDATVFPLRLPSWIHEKRRKFAGVSFSASRLCALMVGDGVPVATATIAAYVTASPSKDGPGEHDDNPHMAPVLRNHEIPATPCGTLGNVKEERSLLKELLNSLPKQQATLLRRLWKIDSDEKGPIHVLQEMNLSVKEGNELQRIALVRLRRHPRLKEFLRRVKFNGAEEVQDFITIRKYPPKKKRSLPQSLKPIQRRKRRSRSSFPVTTATEVPEERQLEVLHG